MLTLGVFLDYSPPYVLKGLLLILELTHSARLAEQQVPGIILPLPPNTGIPGTCCNFSCWGLTRSSHLYSQHSSTWSICQPYNKILVLIFPMPFFLTVLGILTQGFEHARLTLYRSYTPSQRYFFVYSSSSFEMRHTVYDLTAWHKSRVCLGSFTLTATISRLAYKLNTVYLRLASLPLFLLSLCVYHCVHHNWTFKTQAICQILHTESLSYSTCTANINKPVKILSGINLLPHSATGMHLEATNWGVVFFPIESIFRFLMHIFPLLSCNFPLPLSSDVFLLYFVFA